MHKPSFMSNVASLPEIKIDHFIFQVVHSGSEDPILMDETPIAGFESFFEEGSGKSSSGTPSDSRQPPTS